MNDYLKSDESGPHPTHEQSELAELMLETFPRMVAQISCALRRKSPVQNPSQFHLLRRLRESRCTMHELADAGKVRMPTVSRTVDAMVEHKWVERQSDPDDRRMVWVVITELGRDVLRETEAIAEEQVVNLLGSLSPDAREALARAMPALHAAVVQHDKELK